MFNYEWKRLFKEKYLDVQRQLNKKCDCADATERIRVINEDCEVVSALADLCLRYILERANEVRDDA